MKVEKSAKIDGYTMKYLGNIGTMEIYTQESCTQGSEIGIYLVNDNEVMGKFLIGADSTQNCGFISGITLTDLTKEKEC